MRTILTLCLLLASIPLLATPSGLVWIPSTDIQPKGVWHLGNDSYVFTNNGDLAPFVDTGLTYGVTPQLEVGVDYVSPFIDATATSRNPLWFNAKYQVVSPRENQPFALAVGAYNYAADADEGAQLLYAVGSYSGKMGRLTGGVYSGNEDTIGSDNKGYMIGYDRVDGKWWYGADYQSGKNLFGAASIGVGYTLSDKVGVILGYNQYNSKSIVGAPGSVTFQVDINL